MLLLVIAQIAVRNLVASRLKTVIVGGIIFFGAVLVVVGSALVDSVDQGMSRSIVGSVAGHLQVYAARSKDELALFGNMGGDPDLAPVADFAKIKATLAKVPNVKAVVPMGVSGALVTSGNTIDLVLAQLREAIKKRLGGDATPAVAAQIDARKGHVRQMATVLLADLENMRAMLTEKAVDPENVAKLARAASDAFWEGFDRDPLDALEFLENQVAPQATDADLLFIRYIGTDMDAFARSFDRLRIVDGTAVPKGKRGFLFPKFFYEERLKLKTARRLDKIKEGREVNGKRIATDPDLSRWTKENTTQLKELILQLDAVKAKEVVSRLQRDLSATETDLGKLLGKLLATTDENFDERYRLFYEDVAPLLDLYRIRVGDTLTIKTFTRSGYVQSVNVKIYGTFNFSGLEKSALAGGLGLMDLVSFRDLYGYLSADKAEEIRQIKEAAGATEVSREDAEAALFGDASRVVVAEATPGIVHEDPDLKGNGRALRNEELASRVYSQEEIDGGVVLNAALILEDPRRIDETLTAAEDAARRDGLDLKVVSWQKASGLIGQFVMLLRLVLYVAVLIIFVVALVIINNALVMATLERVREIGTLRAIGAQRRFILVMLLVESVVVGLSFSALGALAGAGIVKLIGAVGIPARSDVMFFFFSGPRLFPQLATQNLVAAFTMVLVVSTLASFYPAFLALRVQPVTAMQTED